MNNLPDVLKAADISNYLRISLRHAYQIMDQSDFPLRKFGRCKRVFKEDFIKWADKHQIGGKGNWFDKKTAF